MPQRILHITPTGTSGATIDTTLLANGYVLKQEHELVNPAHSKQPPALCLVDLQTRAMVNTTEWESWLRGCLATQTACLVYDWDQPPDPALVSSLEPISDILIRPDDPIELMTRVKGLLTIRKLVRQLEATRQELASYQDELQEALDSAAHIQRSMIPARFPTYHNLSYAWQFIPYKKVGGDLFNIAQLDEQTVMTYLVDVSGHGISSAMVTVSVHQSLSLQTGQIIKQPLKQPPFYKISSPGEVLDQLEREYPFERFEEFFTISYALINPYTGTLRYANAGHPPPLLLHRDGSVDLLNQGGTVIGIGQGHSFKEGQLQLREGDRLYFYTDGITEHLNSFGQAFGEERLVDGLRAMAEDPVDDTCRAIIKQVQQHGGTELGQDDITLIGVEFSQTSPAGMAT